jgi:HEAT repeat protein
MAQAPTLSPELTRISISLARALSAGARNWALYPPEHPAVDAALTRLADAVNASTSGAVFTFAVTPATLMVAGVALPEDQPVTETARLLHDRDVLTLTFLGEVTMPALHALLQILTTQPDELRAAGGPAAAWEKLGAPASIAIEQIDYEKILEDRLVEQPADRKDDVWQSLVQQIVEGQTVFDERQQRRLLEISGSPIEIGELATAVMAPKLNLDGSPLITTQAATVLATFRHLAGIVNVMEPDRMPDVMRNVAAATATLDPHVVAQLMQMDEGIQEIPIVQKLAVAFDDAKVAELLATALAKDGMATTRLAQVFDTIAPDEQRKRRVLTMARSMLSEHDFGKGGQFRAAWASMEQLLLSYDEKPFVSRAYQTAMEGAIGRAETIAARDLPPEFSEWVETLGQENVRSLSVLLLTDLLRIEEDADRAAEIANDMMALGEDLLYSGDFADVLIVVRALRECAEREKAVAPAACRAALTSVGESLALREAAALLGELDAASLSVFAECCSVIGPSAIRALEPALETEEQTPAYTRAVDIVKGYGASAVAQLTRLADDSRWFVQKMAAMLLGATRSPEAVPTLQTLLRRNDPRVLRPAVSALAGIDDPSAARAIQTVLRVATGENRAAVVEALVAERDPRVVPMLGRILTESDPFGEDHRTVLDTLKAVGEFGDERAVIPVTATMRKKKLFAWRRARAVKEASVQALLAIGTPKARQMLDDAGKTGDRLLRKIIRTTAAPQVASTT